MGLTRPDKSTGGKPRTTGRISKKGDKALRRLLVIGAAAVIARQRRSGRLDPWIDGLLKRRCFRIAAVALAAKNARIAWAPLTRGQTYQPGHQPQLAGMIGTLSADPLRERGHKPATIRTRIHDRSAKQPHHQAKPLSERSRPYMTRMGRRSVLPTPEPASAAFPADVRFVIGRSEPNAT